MHPSRYITFSFYERAAITDANTDPIKMLMNQIPIPDTWLAAPSNCFGVTPVQLAVADGLCELMIVPLLVRFTMGIEVAARDTVTELWSNACDEDELAAAVVSMTGTMVKVTTPILVVVTYVGAFDTTVTSGRYGLELDVLYALT